MLLHHSAPIETSPLAWTELADPIPGPSEVRIKVRCCAICRTDLHIIEEDLPPALRPISPGHQAVGEIDALGPGCRRLKLRTRVGVAWLRHTCGTCRYCTTDRENLCPNSQYTGYHANGGYAEYLTVPENFAYPLPDSIDDLHVAPLLCAGIIGYRAFLRCNPKPNDKLAIFGFGSSAHIILQIARHRGHEVYVVSRSAHHQQLARDLGATWAGADATQLPHRADAAICFAPAGEIVPEALATLAPGGTLALAGIHMSDIPPLSYKHHLYGERDIHPVTANTREDGQNLLTEAQAAQVKPHITRYSLRDANRALQDLKAGKIDGTGVLTIP
jgi:propanol-preferring alcohol dehydrogenase